jgi:hypothetical protein
MTTSAISMNPSMKVGPEKSDNYNMPTAFSAIYNQFVPDPRKQNVTTQVYMNNYIQESLRYLREKPRDYEKKSSSQNSSGTSNQSPAEQNKNEAIPSKSKNEQKLKSNEKKLADRVLTPIKLHPANETKASSPKKISNKNDQTIVENNIKSQMASNGEKIKQPNSHEKHSKYYHTINQNVIKPLKLSSKLSENLSSEKLNDYSRRSRAKSLENYFYIEKQKGNYY